MNFSKNFLIALVATTGILLAAYFGLNTVLNPAIPGIVIWLILSFALLTWVLYRYIILTTNKSPSRFVTAALGSVTVKLLASSAFFGVFVYLNKDGRVETGLSLFVVYMSFTTLLTTQVAKYVRWLQAEMKKNNSAGAQ